MDPDDILADLGEQTDDPLGDLGEQVSEGNAPQGSAQLQQDVAGGNYAETGRVLELPETTVEGRPEGGGSVSVAEGPATEYREVEKRWQTSTDPAEQAPDPRSVRDRLRQYLSGADPEALGSGYEGAPPLRAMAGGRAPSLGGRDLPSLPSIRRAIGAGGDLDVLMPATNTAEPIIGTDRRPLAAATGATDAATFGWLDEISAGVHDDPRVREAERARSEQSQQQAPGQYALGQLAGTAPLAALPAGGASAVGRVGMAAATGAGAGFLAGTGEAEGDAGTRFSAGLDRAVDEAALGAVLGGAGEAAGPLLSRAAETRPAGWLARAADDIGPLRADARLRAAGVRNSAPAATSRAGRSQARLGGPEAIADMLDAEGLGGRLWPTPVSEDDLARLGRGAGARFDDVLARMDEAGGGVSRTALRERGEPFAAELADLDTEAAQRAAETMRRQYLDPLERRAAPGPMGAGEDLMSWGQAHRYRQQLDNEARTFTRATDPVSTSTAGAAQEMRGATSDLMNEAAESVDPAIRDQWRQANRQYSLLSYLEDNVAPSQSRFAGATGEGLAIGEAAIGAANPASAVGARMMGGLTSRYGPGLQARGWGLLQRTLRAGSSPALQRAARVLEGAQRRGPQAVSAAHYMLARRSPEYRRAHDEAARAAAEETDR